MDEVREDERFSHIARDPRFRSMSKKQKKVKIDNRFKTMFSDDRFQVKYSVDKRGRPVHFTSSENLKKYYDLSDSDSGKDSDSSASCEGTDEEDELIAKLSKKVKSKSQKSGTSKGKEKVKSIEKFENDNSVSKKSKMNTRVKKTTTTNGKGISEKKMKDLSDVSISDESENENLDERSHESSVTENSLDDDSDDESDDDYNDKRVDGSPKVGVDEPDYARGEGALESSTEDEDDDDADDDDDKFNHNWGELDKGVAETEDLSCRLAVCNMDWDRIKARDLFIVLNSFKPVGGVIKSVRIYPSEFGLQRMREEEISGPIELKGLAKEVDVAADVDENEDENEDVDKDGNRYHREKLRQYQLNRLKYFYAIVECNSIETANKIYEECDGMEYETSSARIDLRFVPDDMTFEGTVKNECLSLPDTSNYKVSSFFTSALCQSKVDLTWDEDDQDRIKMTMRKFDKKGEVNEDDFKAYLASESDDEGHTYGELVGESDENSNDSFNEEKQIEKYKDLLKGMDDSSNRKGDMDMEITWEPGLKDTAEDLVKSKEKTKGQTPWDEYLQRKKDKKTQRREEIKKKRQVQKEGGTEKTFSDDELPDSINLGDSFFTEELGGKSKKKKTKRKRKELTKEEEEIEKKEKAELELLMMDENEDGKDHFNLRDLVEKTKKRKKKMKKEGIKEKSDDFEVNLHDSRFDAVFKSHLFNIDPSAPEFKKTKGMEAIIHEKLKMRNPDGPKRKNFERDDKSKGATTTTPVEESLSSLITSVKSKTQQFQSKKKLKRK